MDIFDACVIGAGLIGTAAAKYCALNGLKTCLIGPPEPNRQQYYKHDIFGAWYDEGRITRHLDTDPVWAHLADQSIKRYRDIENKSGIPFYTENGYLLIGDKVNKRIEQNIQAAKQLFLNYETLDGQELRKRFPYFNIPNHFIGLYESHGAGTINPRSLVDAQLKLYQTHGGIWIKDIAIKIERDPPTNIFLIHTQTNQKIRTKKILSCSGAFLNHFQLLPSPPLDVIYRTSLTTRVKVQPGPLLDKLLKNMPSFSFCSDILSNNGNGKLNQSFYGLAPILYPDGHYYLKVGTDSTLNPSVLHDEYSVSEWFRSGSVRGYSLGKERAELIKDFIPDLDISQFVVDTCIWLETPTKRPYVGQINDGVCIVSGDMGYSAKSSDELGRLGAMITIHEGVWPDDFLCEDDLRPRFKTRSNSKL